MRLWPNLATLDTSHAYSLFKFKMVANSMVYHPFGGYFIVDLTTIDEFTTIHVEGTASTITFGQGTTTGYSYHFFFVAWPVASSLLSQDSEMLIYYQKFDGFNDIPNFPTI